jgi:hypothetical protein
MGFLAGLVPAAAALLALPFGPRSRADETNIRAVYLFHRNGDPLATVASDVVLPLELSQLEPVLGAVRGFVEADEVSSRLFQPTSERFGEEILVGIRGRFVSACVVSHGPAEGILRRDLVRFIREFEERNEGRLGTWEEATNLAGEASLAMVGLMDARSPSEPAAVDFAAATN